MGECQLRKCSFIFQFRQIRGLGHQKISGEGLQLHKHEELPQYFSHFIEYEYHCPIEPLMYFMGEYDLKCANLYPPILRCSALVILKQQKNTSGSINMNNYNKHFLPFLEYGYRFPIEPLIYFMGEYYLRCAHFYFIPLRSSVLVINLNSRKLALSP